MINHNILNKIADKNGDKKFRNVLFRLIKQLETSYDLISDDQKNIFIDKINEMSQQLNEPLFLLCRSYYGYDDDNNIVYYSCKNLTVSIVASTYVNFDLNYFSILPYKSMYLYDKSELMNQIPYLKKYNNWFEKYDSLYNTINYQMFFTYGPNIYIIPCIIDDSLFPFEEMFK